MAEGNLIGKVAVKVYPDTSKFGKELKEQLEKIEKKKWNKITTPIDLDDKKLVDEVKAAVKKAQKAAGKGVTIKVNLDDQTSIESAISKVEAHIRALNEKTKIKLTADASQMYVELDKLKARLAEIATVDITYEPGNDDSIKAAIAKLEAELSKLRSVKIPISLNEEDLTKEIEKLKAMLSGTADDVITLDVQFNVDDRGSLEAALAQVNAELRKLDAISLPVELDKDSLTTARDLIQDELFKLPPVTMDVAVDFTDKGSLENAIKQVNAELSKLASINVPVELNKDSLSKMKADLETELNAMLATEEFEARVKLTADHAQEQALLDKVQADLDKMTTSLKFKVSVDSKDAKAKVLEIQAVLLALEEKRHSIKVGMSPIDLAKTEAEIAGLELELKALSSFKIGGGFDFSGAASSIAGALGKLGGVNILTEKLQIMQDIFSNFDKYAISIGTTAVRMGGLASAAISAAGELLSVGSSLASIASVGLAVPGILGGLAVGLGLSALALKDFSKYVPQFAGMWATLKQVVSDNFWEKASKPINDMVNNLMPKFIEEAKGTASVLGTYFGNLATSLSNTLGPALSGMFRDLNDSITTASGGTNALATIITVLGQVGASYLPALAQWFVDVTNNFANFLTKNQESGQIFTWIGTGIDNLKALGDVVWTTIQILGSLADAANAAGGTGLQGLADGLHNVLDNLQTIGTQTNLTAIFQGANDSIKNLVQTAGPGLSTLFDTLSAGISDILPKVGTIIGTLVNDISSALSDPAVFGGISQMFDGIQSAVDKLQPIWPALAGAIGQVAPIVGQLLDQFAAIAAVLANTLNPILDKILPPISSLITSIGGSLTTILNNLEPTLLKVGGKIGELLTALNQLWTFIAPVLIPVLQFLAELFLGAVMGAIDGVINVIHGFISVVQGIIDFITGVFTGNWSKAWDGIKEIFSGILDLIVGIFEIWWNVGILKTFSAAFKILESGFKDGFNGIKDFIGNILSAINDFFTGFFSKAGSIVSGGLSGIKGFFTGAFSAIKGFASGLISDVTSFFSNLGPNVLNAITNGFSAVTSFFSGLPGKIISAIGNVGNLLEGIGRTIIQSLIDGIGNMFGSVKDKLQSLTGHILDWKGPYKVDKVLLTPVGELIIDGFITGLENKYDAVKDSLGGLTKDMEGMVNGTNLTANIAAGVGSAASSAYSSGAQPSRVLNYYAAAGSSISAEEDLFTAAGRSRMGAW